MLLRSIPTLATIVSTALIYGQGFPATPVEWSIPNGGFTLNEVSYGFNYVNVPSSNVDNGTEFWDVVDMNGDKMPDLVSTGIRTSGLLDAFASGTGPCWHVFMSNGSGFATEPTLWSLPDGGKISANELGFSKIRGSGGTEGSETWELSDLNGDGRPDLIVTAQNTGGTFTGFSPDNGAYWKVYLNTGTGFSVVSVNWPLPVGGMIMSGNALGFLSIFNTNYTGTTLTTGSDLWNLTDMDGDGLQDLTIFSEFDQALGQPIGFQPNAMSYWKVHLNTGSGFNGTYETWALPNGGGKATGVDLGYNDPFRQNFSASVGSENWSLVDINGDSKADLVVTAARIAGGTDVVFAGNATRYWKVYLNTGSRFSNVESPWTLPAGGLIDDGVDMGFIMTQYQNLGFFEVGSVVWYFRDMDGDQLPDLVITAALTSQSPYTISAYGLPNQFWLVHLNTGSGFTAIAEEWSVPEGGIYASGNYQGFTSFNSNPNQSNVAGFQAWSVLDMDNSGTVDLVVTGETMVAGASVTSVFGTADPHHWKVFLNPNAIGVDEHVAHSSTVKAYPNPTNSAIAVISTGARTLGTVILNSLGAIVGSSRNSTLDLSALEAGMYTLRVSLSDRTVQYLRIIRQ